MFHALIVVLLLGFGDSLNPATIGPAMYLATVEHPRRALTTFLLGFLAVNVLGGLAIMLGPGQLLLDVVPKPTPTARNVIALAAGVVLLGLSVGLWAGRRALGRRTPPGFSGSRRTGVMLGAGIALVELPTAMPYFAAIAVILGSGAGVVGKIALLLIFNAAFLSPVVAILVGVLVFGDNVRPWLERVNRWVLRHWPGALATVAGLLGAAVLGFGVVNLAG